MATRPNTGTRTAAPLQSPRVSATVIDLTERRRVALLRRLWDQHDGAGRAL